MPAVLHVPAFQDNYIWLISGRAPGQVAIVDPGDATPVLAALDRLALTPAAILCTHHHRDHTGGITALVAAARARGIDLPVYGPIREPIPGRTHPVSDGDTVDLAPLGLRFEVLDVPGHTRGHVAYYSPGMLFCGDTLFSAGCGKLFEGTAAQLHTSLNRLAALPADTAVYCAHEYTDYCLGFALKVEPGNPDIAEYRRQVRSLRAAGQPSLPSSMGLERRINPFLRAAEAAVKTAAEQHAGNPLYSELAVFTALRRWMDQYSG